MAYLPRIQLRDFKIAITEREVLGATGGQLKALESWFEIIPLPKNDCKEDSANKGWHNNLR